MFSWLKRVPTALQRSQPQVRSSALFDAAGGGNRLAGWSAPSTDFSSITSPSILRGRARDAYRNNSWARRGVELVSGDAIGGGIRPQFRLEDPDLKRRTTDEWDQWTDAADFSERGDLYAFQQRVLQTLSIDGEALVRFLPAAGQRIPLQVQLLGCEFLDSAIVNDHTANGIEYDTQGRRIAYHLFRKHPADFPDMRSIRVPANQVCHIYRPVQAGAERGVSWLAPVLLPVRELGEFLEAGLVKQKVAALLSGFIHTPDGSTSINVSSDGTVMFEPGTLSRLKPGEEVEFSQPPDNGTSFDPFVRVQLRLIASALNVPYSLLSGDHGQTTFAAGRHELLAYRRFLEGVQHHLVVGQLMRPLLSLWLRMAVAVGVLPGSPNEYSRKVRWIGPVLQALDPKADVQANILRNRAGFASRSEIISESGWDAETVDAELADDNARADRLGLILDTDPRRVTVYGQEQPSVPNQQEQPQ